MWLRSGLSCIWSSYALQFLRHSRPQFLMIPHVTLISWYYLFIFNDMMLSLRQAVNMPFKAVTLTLVYVFLLCSWRQLEAACVTKRQTNL